MYIYIERERVDLEKTFFDSKRGVGGQNIHIPFGQIITTSADVTLNGGLIRELPQNPLNSGLGNILICPDSILAQ